jgi:hypothetical protein
MFGLPTITLVAVGGAVLIVIALLVFWALHFKEVPN